MDKVELRFHLFQQSATAASTPLNNTIFVITKDGEEKFTNQTIESEDIKVDFKKIFGG